MVDVAGKEGRGSLNAVRQRRTLIADRVMRDGTMSVEELVELTGVSAMTIYRDVEALESVGVLVRQRGQVSALATGLNEAGASFRLGKSPELKRSLASAVVSLIGPGSSIMLDDSTTALLVLREIDVTPLTVVTNSMLVARDLDRRPGTRLFLTGGEYQGWAEALMGKTTTDVLDGMHADFCLLSASGIADGRCFHPYEDVVEVKAAMMRSVDRRILLLDHTKFARRALHAFARLSDFHLVVVDSRTPPEVLDEMVTLGVSVVVAEAP